MKTFLPALTFAVAAAAAELRGVSFRRLGADEDSFTFTGTLCLTGGAGPFVKVKHDNPRRWQKLVIDEMDDYSGDIPGTFAWTIDEDNLLHSGLDNDMCIQAGHGELVKHGTPLRLNYCDADNKFQRWNPNIHCSMKLIDDEFNEYCGASLGTTFELGEDHMIMVDCDVLDEDDCGRGCFSFD